MNRSIISALNHIALHLQGSEGYTRATLTELVLQLAKPEQLTRFTSDAYNRNPNYLDRNNKEFHPWEQSIVGEFFPPPPARVLVGACGGGREMVALATLGYEVAGFDPAPSLVDLARSQISAPSLLSVEVASYEDLIAQHGAPPTAPYNALILGWGSLSHLSDPHTRRALLLKARELCPEGPILLSWVHDGPSEPELAVRKILLSLGVSTRDRRESYNTVGGYSRGYSHEEIFALASATSNRVLRYDEGDYPHALFSPRA